MNDAYLLLGSNLNDREHMLTEALAGIRDQVGEVLDVSSIYETEPWGFRSDEPFLNQVVRVSTALSPSDLMRALLEIELELGRERKGPQYASRTIDIDILLYGDRVVDEPELVIPHPRMTERRFTLVPLCEINEGLIHPLRGISIRKLEQLCTDQSRVVPFKPSAS